MKNTQETSVQQQAEGDALRTWLNRQVARRRRRKAMLIATQSFPVAEAAPRERAGTRRAASTVFFDGIVQGGSMGTLAGRPFFSHYHLPGRELTLPFATGQFSCFIHLGIHASDDTLTELVHGLLRHGLYAVYCAGIGAERLGEIFDAILDDGAYFHGDDAVTSMVLEDESIDQAIEYFSLPSGHDGPNLLLTLGSAEHHQATLDAFTQAVERMKLAFCS